MSPRIKKRILLLFTIIAILYLIITPLTIFIVHSVVMSKCTYKEHDPDKFLIYADVAEKYPREKFEIASGKNTLSAWLYGKENTKGLIVVAPGHRDSNDKKLYEIISENNNYRSGGVTCNYDSSSVCRIRGNFRSV